MRHTVARAVRRSRAPVLGVLLALGAAFASPSAFAQEQIVIRADLLFYGDNTEFHGPFRDGETIFGAAGRVAGEIWLNDRVAVSAGAFVNQRFGSEQAFEQVRPVIALQVHTARSSLVFGTLPPPDTEMPLGPDLGGPHWLLPPLQRETLSYERPYETGIAWAFDSARFDHHFWLAWQRLNTPHHRERFDGGLRADLKLRNILSIPLQWHVVHEGGQLYGSGAVSDSLAGATGVKLNGSTAGGLVATLELLAAASRYVPNRASPGLSRDGAAFFGRAAAERNAWRGHVIFWRGRNFMKDEGDPNYQSTYQTGDRYSGIRDYAEAGLARRFTLARAAFFDVSGRLHRVEGRYEYSFRLMSVVSASWKVR